MQNCPSQAHVYVQYSGELPNLELPVRVLDLKARVSLHWFHFFIF
jgi:hypothetical protein